MFESDDTPQTILFAAVGEEMNGDFFMDVFGDCNGDGVFNGADIIGAGCPS